MNQVIKWVLTVGFQWGGLYVGKRINTPWGMGTITGGALNVDLDKFTDRRVNQAVNIDKLEEWNP